MLKIRHLGLGIIFLIGLELMALFLTNCGSGISTTTSSTRTLTANTSVLSSVTTAYGGTCKLLSRDTSSCQSSRQSLGLSGNWLSFSCNVVLGLATSSGASTTSYSSASYVTITSSTLPDYTSNYFPTTGSYSFTAYGFTVSGTYSSMYSAYTTTFPDPDSISQVSLTMNIPINPSPSAAMSQWGNGVVGLAVNGVPILASLAANTDNIFAESGSFDQCQGHPNSNSYHYHSEPYSISYNDNKLVGVMRDGYFIYGRQDSDGSTPGSTANLDTAGSSSSIYIYGGHTGADPILGTGNSFHYHLTEWKGCYHESGGMKSSDDGETSDSINTPSGSCSGSWVDAWFVSGHGNGGVFATIPSGLSGQSPSQTTAGQRYFYGTPGSCSGAGCS